MSHSVLHSVMVGPFIIFSFGYLNISDCIKFDISHLIFDILKSYTSLQAVGWRVNMVASGFTVEEFLHRVSSHFSHL